MRIAVIGAGQVGSALGTHLARLGHEACFGVRAESLAKARAALATASGVRVALTGEATTGAEVVFLATPFAAAVSAVADAGDLTGRILVDCTNPVGPGLRHGLDSRTSGAETIQLAAPGARVVKAFTVYGFENFAAPPAAVNGGRKPAMPLAGDDDAAKRTLATLVEAMGWEPLDCGALAQSLHLEHMTLLRIRMVRVDRRRPNLLWAVAS